MITKKDLFRLLIKLLGVYFLIHTGYNLFLLISMFAMDLKSSEQMILLLVNVGFYLLFSLFLIFLPDKIISWLRLDKSFDDNKVQFQNLNFQKALSLMIIGIGIALIINHFMYFVIAVISLFNFSYHNTLFGTQFPLSTTIMKGGNILIGYLLIKNNGAITRLITKKK